MSFNMRNKFKTSRGAGASLGTGRRTGLFLIIFLMSNLFAPVLTVNLKEKTLLTTQELSLNHFSNNLRLKHINNISLIDNYLTSLAQINIASSSYTIKEIKQNLKKLFKQVGNSIDDVKEGFKKNYEFCVNKLGDFATACTTPIEEMRQDIQHNKQYAISVIKLNEDYDKLINQFYEANIYSVASNVCGGDKDITEKNDVVGLYTKVAKHLDQHFNIFKSEEMEKILIEVDSSSRTQINTDKFLNNLVNKYKGAVSDQGADLHDDYTTQRKNLAQILFNKVSSYMNNSIERKSKLLAESAKLFETMTKSDNKVKSEIDTLKKGRKNNSELAYSLHKENTLTIRKIRKCENLNNLNSKCEESGNQFHSILTSYQKQSESLQNLFNLIKKD